MNKTYSKVEDNIVIKYAPIHEIENACITDVVMAKGFFKSVIKIGLERRHYKLTYHEVK